MPEKAFFHRHGKRIYDRSRYQLDFRNPAVIAHVNEVIDRVVGEYGVGYIKMDYNIEPGIGTELKADSVGAGLLAHERAYLAWLDSVFRKYPDLVIENVDINILDVHQMAVNKMFLQHPIYQRSGGLQRVRYHCGQCVCGTYAGAGSCLVLSSEKR